MIAIQNKRSGVAPYSTRARFFFSSDGQKAAKQSLGGLIDCDQNLVVITGYSGVGKSSLVEYFLVHALRGTQLGVVRSKPNSLATLFNEVARAFHIEGEELEPEEQLQALSNYFSAIQAKRQTTILTIEDAHKLNREVLQGIQNLAQLKNNDDYLLKIIVVGNNDLAQTWPAMPLDLAIHSRIDALTAAETRGFVLERLQLRERTNRIKLSKNVHSIFHYYTGGIPLAIKTLQAFILDELADKGVTTVTEEIVSAATHNPEWVGFCARYPSVFRCRQPGKLAVNPLAVPSVLLIKDNHVIDTYGLYDNKTWIGRSEHCSILLDGASVSRRHACITMEEGTVWLNNLRSSNGLSVNGQSGLRRVLLDGDVVTIASFQLLFFYDHSPSATEQVQPTAQPEKQPDGNITSFPKTATSATGATPSTPLPIPDRDQSSTNRSRTGAKAAVSVAALMGVIFGAFILTYTYTHPSLDPIYLAQSPDDSKRSTHDDLSHSNSIIAVDFRLPGTEIIEAVATIPGRPHHSESQQTGAESQSLLLRHHLSEAVTPEPGGNGSLSILFFLLPGFSWLIHSSRTS